MKAKTGGKIDIVHGILTLILLIIRSPMVIHKYKQYRKNLHRFTSTHYRVRQTTHYHIK